MSSEKTYYPEIASSPDFPSLEQDVISYWQKGEIFEKSVEARDASDEYVFYDGPPFANGLPHHGHLLTGYVKDLFARYHTMKGKRTERRFGWDCHGLPAEMAAEKELGISGRKNIAEFGIDKFNEHCRTSVMQYADQWEWYVNRQARWVDFKNDYKTMETPFMESVIWAFSELHKKGYIYEGFKVMPYSWAAETVLSTSEIRLDDATREKEDKAVTVAFKLKEAPKGAPEADEYYVLAWTTTPWTLPSNLALAVSGEMDYACLTIPTAQGKVSYVATYKGVMDGALKSVLGDLGVKYIDFESPERGVVEIYFDGSKITEKNIPVDAPEKTAKNTSILKRLSGSELIGLTYEPLFPYFAGTEKAFQILDGSDFIEEGSGTGVVHMAPGFGEDDYRICAEAGIETIVPVNSEGRYTDAIYDLPAVTIRHPEREPEGSHQAVKDASPTAQHDDCVIETKRCILRRPALEDEQLFIDLHTTEKVMDTVNDGLMTVEQAKEDFVLNQDSFERYGYGQWAVFNKETGAFMGRAGLSRRAQSNDLADEPILRCALLPEFWHGGYGRELCHAGLYFALSHGDANTVIAGTLPHNPRAHEMLLSLGMRYVKDVMYTRMEGPAYEMTRAEFAAKNPPLTLRGLNVIKETKGACDAEPYTDAQLEKYGLANLRIINWLKQTGQLIKQEDYKHNYPHCWRTDQPIIYMAMSSWFVDVPQFKDRMVELNQEINWMPDHIKDGRFGKWLENAREWSISRSRFWGCPLPVWRSDNPENDELYVFGSIAELEAFFGPHMASSCGQPQAGAQDLGDSAQSLRDSQNDEKFKITDLHRPFIDSLTAPDPKNPEYTLRRVEDVFDCWFESGSMPYAQVHYPFENKEWFESHFPADFIVEYEAQTRGWFYNMMVLSVALFDRVPFKNCICHGVVLDESGRKLSKKLQNYLDPKILFEQYGSDALRWFMMSSAIMRGSELLLDAEGKFIHDAIRLYIKPIWNAYYFFTLYANADGTKAAFSTESENLMDRYILAKCAGMVQATQSALDAYDTPAATQAISEFVEILNNWYIRRNKERFWNDRKDTDKQAAYDTLYTVLHLLSRACAPLLPMVSEVIYRNLTGEASVHLTDWPNTSAFDAEADLVVGMDTVRDVCNGLLSIRSAENIRVRQPLARAALGVKNMEALKPFAELIKEEVNIKELVFIENVGVYAKYKLVINFPVAGKRLGAKMKEVAAAAKSGEWVEQEDGKIIAAGEEIRAGEYDLHLEALSVSPFGDENVMAGSVVAQALTNNSGVVFLDISITSELQAEGTARDVVRLIQQARKAADLNVADRITLRIEASEEVQAAIQLHQSYISEQTLATALLLEPADGSAFIERAELGGEPIALGITRAQKDAA
jgi:isoleucyl-tRNA synthetase/RimJ/RimL family protein N-acetyltransferase